MLAQYVAQMIMINIIWQQTSIPQTNFCILTASAIESQKERKYDVKKAKMTNYDLQNSTQLHRKLSIEQRKPH